MYKRFFVLTEKKRKQTEQKKIDHKIRIVNQKQNET